MSKRDDFITKPVLNMDGLYSNFATDRLSLLNLS